MDDSETARLADASHSALRAELSSIRAVLAERDARLSDLADQFSEKDAQLNDLADQLAERDAQLTERDAQLAEQDKRLVEQAELIRDLQDEIKRLKKLPRRPDLKPSGLGASGGGDTDGSSSGSSGSGRSGKDGKDRRKGRGPRRRNPYLHRREETVGLEGVPAGAVHKGYQDHTVRDIVLYGEEVTYRCEVWQFPDGSRHVAPLPPGVAAGREQYGPGVKALVIMLYHQCQSTVGRIAAMLNAGLIFCWRCANISVWLIVWGQRGSFRVFLATMGDWRRRFASDGRFRPRLTGLPGVAGQDVWP